MLLPDLLLCFQSVCLVFTFYIYFLKEKFAMFFTVIFCHMRKLLLALGQEPFDYLYNMA